jgi:type IX secretion system PorP/SprF family membrane protein
MDMGARCLRESIGLKILLALMFSGKIQGQQLTPFTLYRDHWNLINPAAVSNNYILAEYPFTISASSRFQYLGIGVNWKDLPNTNVINAEWILDNLNSTFGFQLTTDKIGLLGSNNAYLQYAYKLRLSRRDEKFLSFGISAGVANYYSKINGADFPIAEPDIVPTSAYLPDLNIGIYYRNEDKYYLGISFPQFMNLTAKFKTAEKELFSIKRFRHIYAVGGMFIPFDFFGLGDETAILDISGWMRYLPGQFPVLDGNIRYQHNQTFWFGAGVSSQAISHFEVGFLAGKTIGLFDNQIKISIAYDVPFARSIYHLGSSIEASIAYSWY